MTLKYLPALALLASLAAVAPAAAQQQNCDNNRSTPTTDDDCRAGFLLPGGLNAGVVAAGVVGVVAVGALLGDDTGPATFTIPAMTASN